MTKRILAILTAMCLAFPAAAIGEDIPDVTEPEFIEAAEENDAFDAVSDEEMDSEEAGAYEWPSAEDVIEEAAAKRVDMLSEEFGMVPAKLLWLAGKTAAEVEAMNDAEFDQLRAFIAGEIALRNAEDEAIIETEFSAEEWIGETADEMTEGMTLSGGTLIDSGTCGEHVTWTLDSDGVLTISGSGSLAYFRYYYSAPWYSHSQAGLIKKAVIENGVTNIGYYAFNDCKSLTDVTLADSVTSISYRAFSGCSALTNVTIPAGVTTIEYGAFSDCTALTNVTIPNGVTSIGGMAFYGCTSLTNVTIPNSVTSIGDEAFYLCSGLKSIVIPEGVTDIGKEAFSNCENLTSVTLPKNTTAISKAMFSGCSSLKNITIPDSVTVIGEAAFSYCTSLAGITIPDGVTDIGRSAFSTCKSLTSIVIPNGITGIRDYTFAHCTGLVSVTIPDSVTEIGGNAFFECKRLKKVEIPAGVRSIGTQAFNTYDVVTVNYKGDLRDWVGMDIGDYCFANGIKLYLNGKTVENAVIPEGVTRIGNNVFNGIDSLTSVVIPDSVTSIGGKAFRSCVNLKSIVISNNVKSIEEGTFAYCRSLTDITIPEGVTSIGENAFFGCAYLKNIVVPESVTSIGVSAFEDCVRLTGVTIPKGVTVIEKAAFSECRKLTDIVIPAGVTSIGDEAFFGCTYLKNIVIPESVTSIGKYAFYCCTGLTSMIIPESVTSIGDQALTGCENLKVTVDRDTYAHNYCTENKIKVKLTCGDNHVAAAVPAVPANCKTTGLTEGSICSACGKVLVPQEVIPVTDEHIAGMPAFENVVNPVNGEAGSYQEVIYCTVCNREIGRESKELTECVYVVKASGNTAQNLLIGETLLLKANYAAQAGKTVAEWKTSSASIAKVDGNGRVTGIGKGTATVTAKISDGTIATVKISVSDPREPAKIIPETEASVRLALEDDSRLEIGFTVEPETAYDYCTYSVRSSAPGIASAVLENNTVTVEPVSTGTATITLSAKYGAIVKTANVKVTVYDPQKLSDIRLDIEPIVMLKMPLDLREAAVLDLGEVLQMTKESGDVFAWRDDTAYASVSFKSNYPSIAKVDADGVVTAVKPGTAVITVTVKRGSVTKTAKVSVKAADPCKLGTVSYAPDTENTISMEETISDTGSIDLGAALSFAMMDGTRTWSEAADAVTVSFKSSSAAIAKVDADTGVVTAVKPGTASITATVKRLGVSKTAVIKIKVIDPYKPTGAAFDAELTAPVMLELSEDLSDAVTLDLMPHIMAKNANGLCPADGYGTVTWKSSSTKIAKVDAAGVVQAVAPGTATITATVKRSGVSKSAVIKVTVTDPMKLSFVQLDDNTAVTIILSEYKEALAEGTYEPIVLMNRLMLKSIDDNDFVYAAEKTGYADVAWKSSAAKYVKVDAATGEIIPAAKGTATITGTVKRAGVSKTVTVKVTVK